MFRNDVHLDLNSDKIRKSLKTIIKNNLHDGRIKPHNVLLHIVGWIVMLAFGVLGLEIYLSPLTMSIFIISSLLLTIGSISLRNKDYGWFIYYAYNISGGILCAVVFCFACAQDDKEGKYIVTIIILFLFFMFTAGFITYKIVNNKIQSRWKRNYGKSTPAIVVPLALIGNIIAKFIPERIGLIYITISAGIIIGIAVVWPTLIYYYGKKYDPNADIIRQVEEEAKEKAMKVGIKYSQ